MTQHMTADHNLIFLSAAEQGRMIRHRAISPVDLEQVYLDRIHKKALGHEIGVTRSGW